MLRRPVSWWVWFALLDAMGLAPSLEPDVAAVALAYQPHAPVPPAADAAADHLVAARGGRTEESAARVCVLVHAHAAMLALIARLQGGRHTRRPGQALALHLADAGHQ